MTVTAPGSVDSLLDGVRAAGAAIAADEAADPEAYPASAMATILESGLLLAPLPAHAGGVGASTEAIVQVTAELAAASGSLALLVSMPLGLAGVYAIDESAIPAQHRDGWAAQVERIGCDYRAGRIYAACNSEKGAGGSLAATKTVARRDATGAFCLTGEKILASFGRHADVFFSTARTDPAELPGGDVEFFYVPASAPGVEVLADWDGFGMRATESQSVRYTNAAASGMMGFPNFIATVQPVSYFHLLFAAIPLGCAAAILRGLGTPAPSSPALRLRLSEAQMRQEAMRAYLLETARLWRPAAGPAYGARVVRTKAYVSAEATKLAAELFALSGGRHYRRGDPLARALADSFAGTSLRPPLPLALDMLIESFGAGE